MKKKKEVNGIDYIIPGVVYEYSPNEADNLGAFYDPAANELSTIEAEEEIEKIEANLKELDRLEIKEEV